MAVRTTRSPWARRLVEGVFVAVVLGLVGAVTFMMGGGDDTSVAADAPASIATDDGDAEAIVLRPTARAWVSSPTVAERRLAAPPNASDEPTRRISVDLSDRRQTWTGAGAALTDSSVALLEGNTAALDALFAAEFGAGLNLVRLPLSATDFSDDAWTWSWDAESGVARPTPETRRAVDLLDDVAARVGDDLSVAAAAWTAPAEFTAPTAGGHALAAGSESEYATMLSAQATWLVEQGVPLGSLSLGNEPGHVSDYPTMAMSDDQMIAMATEIAPALDTLDVDLVAVDHNWADRARVDAVVAGAPGAFDAAAFHCYTGEPADMAGLDIPAVVTECTGTTDSWAGTFAWDARQLVEGSIAHGSTGLMMWNLALDPSNGPKRDWGCAECRGLLTVDPATGSFEAGPEYFVLAHLTRAALPGSVVLGVETDADVAVAAFEHPDGTVGVFGYNDSGVEQVVEVAAGEGRSIRIAVAAGDLFTVTL